ncbi:MAG TPA: hypothetical protein VLA79_01570 [Polyangia bacterium]|nr:hypothetical protein [Polyangia bacterium]
MGTLRALRRSGVLALALAAWSTAARAGCPNVCQISGATVQITPPLDCLHLKAAAETCDCGVLVDIDNQCAAPIEATGSPITTCLNSAGYGAPCPSLEPMAQGSLVEKADAVGSQVWTLALSTQGTSHSLSITADVTSMGDGGCAAAAGAPHSRMAAWFAVAGVIALAARRRRRRSRRGRHLGRNSVKT